MLPICIQPGPWFGLGCAIETGLVIMYVQRMYVCAPMKMEDYILSPLLRVA